MSVVGGGGQVVGYCVQCMWDVPVIVIPRGVIKVGDCIYGTEKL